MSRGLTPSEASAALRAYCLAKPGAAEEHPWGDMAWKVNGRMFACGGEGSALVTVKATPEEQAALVGMPHVGRATYLGRFG